MISMGMWFEDNLSGYVFNAVNHDWAQAIANFRSYGKYEPLDSVDVIEGPIADDSVWDITRGYLFGSTSEDDFLDQVRFAIPTHQLCLKTQIAMNAWTLLREVT